MEKTSFTNQFLSKKRNKSQEDYDSESATEENINEKSDVNINEGFQMLKKQINELNEKIQLGTKDMSFLKNKVYNLDFENMKSKNDINKFKIEINTVKLENKELKELIKELQIKNEILEIKNKRLEAKNEILENKNKRLENKSEMLEYNNRMLEIRCKSLENKVDSLLKFVFKAKLIKLLKKLLQYIVKYYKNYVLYNKFENKISFIEAPFVEGLRGYDIKKALNKMLNIIFTNIKKIISQFILLIKQQWIIRHQKKRLKYLGNQKISLNILKFQNIKN